MTKNIILSLMLISSLTFSYVANSGTVGKMFSGIFTGIVVDALGKAYNNITGKTDIDRLKKELSIIKIKIPEMKESIDSLVKKIDVDTNIEEYMKLVKVEENKLSNRIDRNELRIKDLEKRLETIEKSQMKSTVKGEYKGIIVSGGIKYNSSTKIFQSITNKLVGSYYFFEDNKKITGLLYECNWLSLEQLKCTWKDRYGVGGLSMSFNKNFTKFNGSWNAKGSNSYYLWNGSK